MRGRTLLFSQVIHLLFERLETGVFSFRARDGSPSSSLTLTCLRELEAFKAQAAQRERQLQLKIETEQQSKTTALQDLQDFNSKQQRQATAAVEQARAREARCQDEVTRTRAEQKRLADEVKRLKRLLEESNEEIDVSG